MKRLAAQLILLSLLPSTVSASTDVDPYHHWDDRRCAHVAAHWHRGPRFDRIMAALVCVEVNGSWVSGKVYAA